MVKIFFKISIGETIPLVGRTSFDPGIAICQKKVFAMALSFSPDSIVNSSLVSFDRSPEAHLLKPDKQSLN